MDIRTLLTDYLKGRISFTLKYMSTLELSKIWRKIEKEIENQKICNPGSCSYGIPYIKSYIDINKLIEVELNKRSRKNG